MATPVAVTFLSVLAFELIGSLTSGVGLKLGTGAGELVGTSVELPKTSVELERLPVGSAFSTLDGSAGKENAVTELVFEAFGRAESVSLLKGTFVPVNIEGLTRPDG